jgi:hypothetical protein
MKNPVTFHRIAGRVVSKLRGGRGTRVIQDKRKRSPKHKPLEERMNRHVIHDDDDGYID